MKKTSELIRNENGTLKSSIAYYVKTQEDCDCLLELFEKEKIYWISGANPTNFNRWEDYSEDTCIIFDKYDGLTYSRKERLEENGIEIIEFVKEDKYTTDKVKLPKKVAEEIELAKSKRKLNKEFDILRTIYDECFKYQEAFRYLFTRGDHSERLIKIIRAISEGYEIEEPMFYLRKKKPAGYIVYLRTYQGDLVWTIDSANKTKFPESKAKLLKEFFDCEMEEVE